MANSAPLSVESDVVSSTAKETMDTIVSNTIVATQDYTEPVEDPYNKAISYLERHNILQLFQHLTTDVIYHRPQDPLDYLIQEVQQMKQQREADKSNKK